MNQILEILKGKNKAEQLALFQFSTSEPNKNILARFNLWARFFFPHVFEEKEAPFHAMIDEFNMRVYKDMIKSFTDIAFRGAAKTTRTKLFIAFCIINDEEHWKRYIKVLTKDLANSKQIVTDIYNYFVDPKLKQLYPNIFEKSDAKREETMASFTTSFGVKLTADTVGTDQRGQIQDASRPDLIWFEDFETRKTLRSAVETKALWDNMEEARTGLSRNGSCIYTANYISERGNVHRLVQKENMQNKVLITPLVREGNIAWDIYTQEMVKQIEDDADDYEGEYLCKPSASMDVMFDRQMLERTEVGRVWKEIAGFKMFSQFDPSHRYASGHDVAGGVGLDSSTSVFIDFHTMPARVVATFNNNKIKPEIFGDEISRQLDYYDGCLCAPERNNQGIATIVRLKQLDRKIFAPRPHLTKINIVGPTEWGWHTNAQTKPKMMYDLVKAVENGHLLLIDPDLIAEAKSYSRDDLMDKEIDPRLSTRHFDLLIAAAICWQMKDFAIHKEKIKVYSQSQPKANVAL